MKFKKPAFPYIIVLASIVLFSVFFENILLNLTQNNLVFQVGKNNPVVTNKTFDEMVQSIAFNEKKYRRLARHMDIKKEKVNSIHKTATKLER
jgi:hypothetical protein